MADIPTPKSVWLALVLTILFGPLGMLYTTVLGAIVMILVSGLVAWFMFGVGLGLVYLICIIWGVGAAVANNKKLPPPPPI